MAIQGTMGCCEGGSMSATYSPTQYNEFIHDAEELGFDTDVTSDIEFRAWALDSRGKITGEWSSDTGGQLAWAN